MGVKSLILTFFSEKLCQRFFGDNPKTRHEALFYESKE